MKLNKNGRWAQLYKWTYTKNEWALPNSLCPFFWATVIAILLFPVMWISYPFYACNVVSRFFKSIGLWIVLAVIGGLIGNTMSGDYTMLWVLLGLIGFTLVLIGTIVGVGFLGMFTGETIRNAAKSNFVQETKAIIKEKKDSFWENYCPKITWSE